MKKLFAILVITAAFNAVLIPLLYYYSGDSGGKPFKIEAGDETSYYARLNCKVILRCFEPSDEEYLTEDAFEDNFQVCVFPGTRGGGEVSGEEIDGVRRRYMIAFRNPRIDDCSLTFDCCTISCNSELYVLGNRFRIGDPACEVTHRMEKVMMKSRRPALLFKQDFPVEYRGKKCFVVFYLLAFLTKIGEANANLPATAPPVNAGEWFKIGVRDEEKEAAWNSVDGLAVRIESGKSGFIEGEPVIVKYFFRNVSEKPLKLWMGPHGLGSRLADSSPDQLIIKDGDGVPLSREASGRLPEVKSGSMNLQPGETYSGAYRVTDSSRGYAYYRLPPGRYTACLVYSVRREMRVADTDYWTGKVESNEVEIEIAGKR